MTDTQPATSAPAAPVLTPADAPLAGLAEALSEELDLEQAADEQEQQQPEEQAKPAGEKPAAATDDDFGDDKPWTPERVKACAAKAKELLQNGHKIYAAAEKRARKDSRTREELLTEKRTFEAIQGQFYADVRAAQTGDAKTSLEAMGRLLRKDPIKLLEDWSLHIAKNGKRSEPSPEVLELRAELAAVKKQLEDGEKAKRDAELEQRLEQRYDGLAQTAQDAEKWPLAAYYAQENPKKIGRVIGKIIVDEFQRTRRKLTDSEAVDKLEEALQSHHELTQRAQAKRDTASGAGSGRETRAQAKPETAQSTPSGKGRSLPANLATSSAPTRELTEEEQADDAADYLPAAWLNFGRG